MSAATGSGKTDVRQQRFASSQEFSNLFEAEVPSLFQLAYVLTGERKLAEQCFMTALDACLEAPAVFREWAYRWARRAVIRSAVQLLRERKAFGHSRPTMEPLEFEADEISTLYRIVSLPELERLVYVLAILEGYSKMETAVLLGTSPGDVQEARTQAVLRLSSSPVLNGAVRAASVS